MEDWQGCGLSPCIDAGEHGNYAGGWESRNDVLVCGGWIVVR